MFFRLSLKVREKKTHKICMPIMPITTDSVTRDLIWRYLPEEILDPSAFAEARSLVIMSDYPLPLLDPLCNVWLHTLKFLNMDVANLPDSIPVSVRTLLFHNTTLSDLNQIPVVNWSEIGSLVLSSNPLLNGTSLVVPEGLLDLKIISQNLRNIRFTGNPATGKQARKLIVESGSFDKLTGYLPRNQILLYSSTQSIYTQPTQEIIRQSQEEINKMYAHHHYRIKEKRDKNILECIRRINEEIGYSLYAEFGSIPKRIRVSEENFENPIVVAMNLSSNYPRRMAEFVNEK